MGENFQSKGPRARINSRLPYIVLRSRITHYLKRLSRGNLGITKDRRRRDLNIWVHSRGTGMTEPGDAPRVMNIVLAPCLRDGADDYLSVRASMPADQRRQHFPLRRQAGSLDRVTRPVRSPRQGIPLHPALTAIPLWLKNPCFAHDLTLLRHRQC